MPTELIEKDQAVFLHIPKTAGSSFTHILKSLYPDDKIFHRMDANELEAQLKKDQNQHRLYIGHYSYEVIGLFSQRPHILTFLREPRERMISHYYFYKIQSEEAVARMPPHDQKLMELIQAYDFGSFISLDREEVEQGFANVQTRQLATSTTDAVPQDKTGRNQLLAAAIEHLSAMDFIGIVERFDESLQVFSRIFGLTTTPTAVSTNINKSNPNKASDLAVFNDNPLAKRRVELDITLYGKALEQFGHRLAGPSQSPQHRLWQHLKQLLAIDK